MVEITLKKLYRPLFRDADEITQALCIFEAVPGVPGKVAREVHWHLRKTA